MMELLASIGIDVTTHLGIFYLSILVCIPM